MNTVYRQAPREYLKFVGSIISKELLVGDSATADLSIEQVDTMLSTAAAIRTSAGRGAETARAELMEDGTIKAAIERLEQERERLIAEKIEKGLAVRASPLVVGSPDEIDAARAREIAALREAGETREIVFGDGEIEVIITGRAALGARPSASAQRELP